MCGAAGTPEWTDQDEHFEEPLDPFLKLARSTCSREKCPCKGLCWLWGNASPAWSLCVSTIYSSFGPNYCVIKRIFVFFNTSNKEEVSSPPGWDFDISAVCLLRNVQRSGHFLLRPRLRGSFGQYIPEMYVLALGPHQNTSGYKVSPGLSVSGCSLFEFGCRLATITAWLHNRVFPPKTLHCYC